MMTLTEIAWELASLKTEGQIDWQAVAKLVQSWLDAPRELRMVPGPPPEGVAGQFAVQWKNGFSQLSSDGMHGKWAPGISAHLGPILPYKPPKPLTEAEAKLLIIDWLAQDGREAIRETKCLILGEFGDMKRFPGDVATSLIAAAEWIRAQEDA